MRQFDKRGRGDDTWHIPFECPAIQLRKRNDHPTRDE